MKYALLDALGTAMYVSLVASFMYFAGQNAPKEDGFFVPVAMLMLLVLSVAIVASLIFGRPVMWYIDGKKKDALRLLLHTLGIFAVITFVVLILLVGVFVR